MKKIAVFLFVILMVPCCAIYAQDCSERIQAAGRIYERYKKTYDPKMFEEAKKQLVNIKNTPGAPENCKKEAERLLKEWKLVYKPSSSKSNVDVAPIVVRVDTVVKRHVSVDSVVNVIYHHDSLKAKRYYEADAAASACVERRDYGCAVDNYQTALAYGRELQMGEDILNDYQEKIQRNKKMYFNSLLSEAKANENDGEVKEALQKYQDLKSYGLENKLIDEKIAGSFDEKIYYLQLVEQMFEYVKQSNEYYSVHEWELAKQELEMAIEASDTLGWKRGVVYWKHRLDTINRILEAGETVFDYATLNESAYKQMGDQIQTALQNALLRFEDIPTDTMTVTLFVAPDGKAATKVNMQKEDTTLFNAIDEELAKIYYKLPSVKYYGQSVMSKAIYDYVVLVESETVTAKRLHRRVKKQVVDRIEVDPKIIGLDYIADFIKKTGDTVMKMEFNPGCKDFLYGKFQLKQTVVQVNNTSRSGFHLEKYYGSGGPANALLSMVVPGLGRHRVTYGQQDGVATAVMFYLTAAASLGCYYGAFRIGNDGYTWKNYTGDLKNFFKFKDMPTVWNNLATDDELETRGKQGLYITSYIFAGIAATLYVTDVLYTLIRGSVNLSRQNKYKKWSIGVFYEPATRTPVLQYNYKIK